MTESLPEELHVNTGTKMSLVFRHIQNQSYCHCRLWQCYLLMVAITRKFMCTNLVNVDRHLLKANLKTIVARLPDCSIIEFVSYPVKILPIFSLTALCKV